MATTAPELLQLLKADPARVAAFRDVRPADIADALRRLPGDVGARAVAALPFDLAVQVLDEPELTDARVGIVRRMPPDAAVPLIDAMSADQQASLFRDLPEPERSALLQHLDPEGQRALQLLLRYPPHTAGGIMTTEAMTVPATATVGETLERIARVGTSKETVYTIFVLDPAHDTLQRAVALRDLLGADRDAPIGSVGSGRAPLAVAPTTDREEVARTISKYNLLALPVVDAAGRMLGIVTVDDVIDALVREQTEDIQKLGGVEALDEPYPKISFVRMVRKRAGWLCALFLSEMLTATAMQHFEGEIARAVVLSMFIPLVMSSGGNSGSQATSLVIRALALREVRLGDWWRIALRELPTGLTLGAILGVIGVVRIELWQRLGLYDYGPSHLLIAIAVGLALVGIVAFGSLAGSMLPFLLKRIGFDPASASAPFVATLVDVTGLVIYFSVALLVLRGALL